MYACRKAAITAAAATYSTQMQAPVRQPAHDPNARAANAEPPPASGMMVANSASVASNAKYMAAPNSTEAKSPPQPP